PPFAAWPRRWLCPALRLPKLRPDRGLFGLRLQRYQSPWPRLRWRNRWPWWRTRRQPPPLRVGPCGRSPLSRLCSVRHRPALGLRNFGVGGEFGFLAGLGGLRRTNHGIAIGFRLGDLGVPLDLGNPRFAQCFEIALTVANIADGKADNRQPHVGHVPGCDFLN